MVCRGYDLNKGKYHKKPSSCYIIHTKFFAFQWNLNS